MQDSGQADVPDRVPLLSLIRNSSSLRPDLMAATNQRGRLPRPDHVSEVCGFRYFGMTAGYRRRGLRSALELAA